MQRTSYSAMDNVHTRAMDPKAIAVRILIRSCGNLQGSILLVERGMISEARTLTRGLVESALCISALHDNPDTFMRMLKEDSDASRKRQAIFISTENLAEKIDKSKLEGAINRIGAVDAMNMKKIAKLGPFRKIYLNYQRLSDDAAHLSAKSLDRHIYRDANNAGWCYRVGPGDSDEISATLYHAIMSSLAIGVGVTQILGDKKNNRTFGRISNRLLKMPAVMVI